MSNFNEPIERIEGSSEIESSQGPQEAEPQRQSPDKQQFDNMMQGQQQKTVVTSVQQAQNPSPMDMARDLSKSSTPVMLSYDRLSEQADKAAAKIEEVKKLLQHPDAKVKKSAQALLNNTLSHIDESLRVALSKAGLEYQEEGSAGGGPAKIKRNPVERFLDLLTNGQNQLERLGGELRTMADKKGQLNPVEMLAIQVKVNQIQQQIELFTSLLSKGLESIKTIMNVQV